MLGVFAMTFTVRRGLVVQHIFNSGNFFSSSYVPARARVWMLMRAVRLRGADMTKLPAEDRR